eukprot:UN15133
MFLQKAFGVRYVRYYFSSSSTSQTSREDTRGILQ